MTRESLEDDLVGIAVAPAAVVVADSPEVEAEEEVGEVMWDLRAGLIVQLVAPLHEVHTLCH